MTRQPMSYLGVVMNEEQQIEAAFVMFREAGLRDLQVQRDRWQEARLGGALRFHASTPGSRAYWQGVYRRWSQLYQRSQELGLTR